MAAAAASVAAAAAAAPVALGAPGKGKGRSAAVASAQSSAGAAPRAGAPSNKMGRCAVLGARGLGESPGKERASPPALQEPPFLPLSGKGLAAPLPFGSRAVWRSC